MPKDSRDSELSEFPRKLTQDEMSYICDFIIPLKACPFRDIANNVANEQIKDVVEQLHGVEIENTDEIDELKEEMIKQYQSTLVNPGEMVGSLASQSVSENTTQSTLDSFHFSGMKQKTTTSELPRMTELLSATKNPKTVPCNVYMNRVGDSVDSIRNLIGRDIRDIRLSEISKIEIYNKNDTNYDWWREMFELLINDHHKYLYSELGEWHLKISIDKEFLYEYKITLKDIADQIKLYFTDVCVVTSPLNISIILVYIPIKSIDLGTENIELMIKFYIVTDIIPELMDLQLFGISEITSIYYAQDDDKHWYIIAEGSNMLDMFMLEYVDIYKTVSNNVWEIYEIFGIEAAKNFLLEEFKNVFAGNVYINMRHIMILVYTMTYSGTVTSFSRFGIDREQSGAIAKSSFEECLPNFQKAAMFSEYDGMKSISSTVMFAKNINAGTAMSSELLVDMDMLEKYLATDIIDGGDDTDNANEIILEDDIMNAMLNL